MALSGLDIQKLLPKTNCKECGSNTCLAFAMKLAGKKAMLSECPYASDEAKAILGAASEPPLKTIAFGPDKKLNSGEETVLYRHAKTFVNQTLLAIEVRDSDPAAQTAKTLQQIKDYLLVRVGMELRVDMVAVTQKGTDDAAFVALAKQAWEQTGKPLVLRSSSAAALVKAAEAVKGSGCLLSAATKATAAELKAAASANGHALAVTGNDLDEICALSAELKAGGFNDLVLQYATGSLSEAYQTNSLARRMAIKENFKPLGYPTLKYLDSADLLVRAAQANVEICKYGGILVLPEFDAAELVNLMTMRLNIFTDPQKPIQVEPKVYAIGEPNENSPVFVTTNFSLTYFIVSGEVENTGISAWLVIPECEGMSVLTAWAAGKFNGGSVAKAVKEFGLFESNKNKTLVIPGYVAQISGEIEEGLPGWNILVGPQEASDLESFIKNRLSA